MSAASLSDQASNLQRNNAVTFSITGDVGAPTFPNWIKDYAHKLDIIVEPVTHSETRITIMATGIPEMLDSLMLACLLGPSDVLVDDVCAENSEGGCANSILPR